MPTETADRIQFSTPIAISRLKMNHQLHAMARADPEQFDALERKGFKTERYGDVIYHLNERLGGFYMDVGASAKISQGRVSKSAISCYRAGVPAAANRCHNIDQWIDQGEVRCCSHGIQRARSCFQRLLDGTSRRRGVLHRLHRYYTAYSCEAVRAEHCGPGR